MDRLDREPNPVELGMFGALWSEHRVESQGAPAVHEHHAIYVVEDHDEVWYANPGEHRLALSRTEPEPWDPGRRLDGCQMQLRATRLARAAPVGSRIRLEIHPLAGADAQVDGEGRATESGVTTHGGVGAIGVVVDHPGGAGVRSGSDENDAVGTDAGPPRADGPHVLWRPLSRGRHARVQHDEIVPRSRHLVDRKTDQMRPNQPMSRRRGTFHTASRTMAPFILLCPSLRSAKTIGISRSLNPFRHARTLISI